jgi:hypothetical protein
VVVVVVAAGASESAVVGEAGVVVDCTVVLLDEGTYFARVSKKVFLTNKVVKTFPKAVHRAAMAPNKA